MSSTEQNWKCAGSQLMEEHSALSLRTASDKIMLCACMCVVCVGVCVCVCVCARARARVYHGWQKNISVTVARRNFVRTDGEIPSRASDLWGE